MRNINAAAVFTGSAAFFTFASNSGNVQPSSCRSMLWNREMERSIAMNKNTSLKSPRSLIWTFIALAVFTGSAAFFTFASNSGSDVQSIPTGYSTGPGPSSIELGPDGKLIYNPEPNGDTIPDFSYV